VTTRALLPEPTIVRETRAGAADVASAVFANASRGAAFTTFQLSAVARAPVKGCCETPPPATGKTPLARLIGSFPFASSGCTGTNPSKPFFDRMKTPVTGRNGANPPKPNPPNPSPGDHSHP
jgi:hypothetical protein